MKGCILKDGRCVQLDAEIYGCGQIGAATAPHQLYFPAAHTVKV
jgi:hypothetical protein